MAITTLAGAAAGALVSVDFIKTTGVALTGVGVPMSLAYGAGYPPVMTVPTGATGTALTSLVGQLPFPAATSGNTYIAKFEASTTVGGTLILYDRLWHNGSLSATLTTAQTISSVAWPARDINEATAGEGVYVGLEISTTTGAAAPTLTLSYTNSAGVAGRTGVNIMTTIASSGAGVLYPFSLQNGDTGVQSIQTLTLSTSWLSGAINLVAYRPVLKLATNVNRQLPYSVDAFTGCMPRLFDNSVPMLMFHPKNSGVAVSVNGYLEYTRG